MCLINSILQFTIGNLILFIVSWFPSETKKTLKCFQGFKY